MARLVCHLVAVRLESGARRALSREDDGARRGPFLLGQSTDPFIGTAASRSAPTTTEAGMGSKTSAGALDRGGRGRTSGYRGAWPTTNTGAPRGGPDYEGGLGARNALGRRGTSAGARPGRRDRGNPIELFQQSQVIPPPKRALQNMSWYLTITIMLFPDRLNPWNCR
jgi:hypothetical protein